jgi:hypothetical protein
LASGRVQRRGEGGRYGDRIERNATLGCTCQPAPPHLQELHAEHLHVCGPWRVPRRTATGASANALDAKLHQHRPVLTQQIRKKIHQNGNPRPTRYHRFQIWIALHFARILSSAEFLWFCIALDCFEIPAIVIQIRNVGLLNSAITIVTFLAQTVIQLIALPVLGEQARLKEEADDARELEQTRTLNAIHKLSRDVHEWQEQQMEILSAQDQTLAELKEQR